MFVNAYYFRAHMYTIVPRHVREDMAWMADHGTDAVTIGVLEQDLFAGVENMQLIRDEARRAGLAFYVTPSLEQPDRTMAVIGRHLAAARR